MNHALSSHNSPTKTTPKHTDPLLSPQSHRFYLSKTFIKNSNSAQVLKTSARSSDIVIQPLDLDGCKKDSFSKLPAITDMINVRGSFLDPDVNKAMIDLTKYAQNLEHVIRSKDKEIQRLEYINKYLTLAQQNKEQLLMQTLEENRKLKDMTLVISNEKKSPEKKSHMRKSGSQTAPLNPITSKKMRRQDSNGKIGEDTGKLSTQTSEFKNSSPLLGKNKPSVARMRDDRKNQSILLMSEDEVNAVYTENENFAFLEELLKTEDGFIQQVNDFDKERMGKLYDAIKTMKEDHLTLRDLVLKMRRIVKATIRITTSLMLDEAIERIVDETCECLDCDRATTFIYDNSREELWSKRAKGSDETIRVPTNKGIVGHVFTKGESLNIHNAYMDERFNREVDMKTGYKTTTMLSMPVRDDNGRVIGVVQAVNKKGTNSIFTKDDEALLDILSNLAGIVLRNTMTFHQQVVFQNTLRSAFKTGIYLNSIYDLTHLLVSAEKKLKALLGVDRAQIVIKHPNKNELYYILADGTRQTYPLNCGIIGKVTVSGEFENITNGYSHPLFNGLVDIETSLPLLCIPILHPTTDRGMGAIEVINTKGIQGLAALQKASVDTAEKETIELFSKSLAQAILNSYEWERLQARIRGEKYPFDEMDPELELLMAKDLSKSLGPKHSIRQLSHPPEESHRAREVVVKEQDKIEEAESLDSNNSVHD